MATKRVMVMVTATRVGEGGGRQNEHWRRRQEQLLWLQGWRARNSIQGNVECNSDAMARPTPTTTFDVRGGGGQRPPSSWAPQVTLGDNGPVLVVPFHEIWHQQQIFLQPFLTNVVP